jgi:eukaryotic-like serine/threonine-protein kinase
VHDTILDLLRRHGHTPSDALSAELDALVRSTAESLAPPALLVVSLPLAETWSDEHDVVPSDRVELPARYHQLGVLGVGGMGKVLKVHDAVLGRVVAMKIAHAALSSAARSRFVAEAQVVAQLQHPGIVPVYDLGTLGSGEPYFTMPVVGGTTLAMRIRAVHGDAAPGGRDFTLRRLVAAFHALADALGYAHARGVVHRDMKPENVIVEDHGSTVIVDWGLAKVMGGDPAEGLDGDPWPPGAPPPVQTTRSAPDSRMTLDGAVIGTLGYMPPEQARGELHRVDARADVHALGATLYEILCGTPPFAAFDRFDALTQVIAETPARPTGPAVPEELAELALRCLEKEPDARPATAAVVAEAVEAWLAGAHRRERALAEVEAADRALDHIRALRQRAERSAAEADARMRDLRPHEPEARKREAWALQDMAERCRSEAELMEVQRVDALQGALRTDPNLIEAHDRLADHFRSLHQAAEGDGDSRRAAQLLHMLRAHDVAGRHRAYIEGAGTVTLVSDPSGAEVEVFRYERRDRRLVPEPVGTLGTTPLIRTRLPKGSYRLELRHGACAPVRVPLCIERGADWDGVGPGEAVSRPIVLPPAGGLGPDDLYVPAGWFTFGGDPLAEWPRPARRRWVEGFVIRRFPVSNGELIAFLDDLMDQGRSDEAERHQPTAGGEPVYGRTADGRFVLRPDPDGDEWLPDHPALLVDWAGAGAFAAWEAERTGLPWRLPREVEWEKAARGVDGRRFPWGDFFDPSWTRCRASQVGKPLPVQIGAYPVDESPYGVRDLAGNVHDWCEDVFVAQPDEPRAARDPEGRVVRGGAWHAGERWSRSASRGVAKARFREAVIGFRLARSWPT